MGADVVITKINSSGGFMKRLMVTGCGGSAGNNFIRSLRLANEKFYIVGTDVNKYHIKLSSADKDYLICPYTHRDYIPTLNGIIKKEKIELLHSQPDTEVQVISENREKIITKTMLPSKSAIRLAFNKLACAFYLKEFDVPVPHSFPINNLKDLHNAIEFLEKRGHKIFWVRAIRGAGSRASLPVKDYNQAKMWIDYWNDMKDVKWGDFMISEFLPGKEYAFQSIWKKGELITSQARERIEYLFGNRMPSGQSSTPTIAKTVSNERVNQVGFMGITAIDKEPNGIYCVDLKENKEGVPCITEINAGRFFTTSIFFSTAGCNMPYMYVKSAYNEPLPLIPRYNPLREDLYWIRQIDMQERLITKNELNSN